MENNEKVVNMFSDKARVEGLKRKVDVIKEIAIERSLAQLQDPTTFMVAGAAGLWQGLKYKGSLKAGIQAGVSTIGVMVGVNVANGVMADIDRIKNT